MSDFDRIEEARERNEGLYYEEYHEKHAGSREEDEDELRLELLLDWRYDVANGDTLLGFEAWIEHNKEVEEDG